MVRDKGLEPSRREAPDPKSGASTNSANPACVNGAPYRTRTYNPQIKSLML